MSSNAELAEKVDQAPAEKDRPTRIQELLQANQEKYEQVLAGVVDSKKFLGLVLREVRVNPKLAEASIPSLLGAVLGAAQLGLEPGGTLGHAYLVPYKKEVQLVIGYKGMVQLAMRSGLIASISAQVVREGDVFDFEYGTNFFIRHRPEGGHGGEVTHAYAVARLVTGGDMGVVLFKEDIERRRSRSKATGSNSPWQTDYDEMARKSAIRALFRDLPASTQFQKALGFDERQFQSEEEAELADDVWDVEEVE